MKGFIFDLDGVIVDTARFHFKAWRALAEQWGYSLSHKDNEQLKGVSRMNSIRKISEWAKVDLQKDELEKMADLKNEPCGAGVLESTLDASAATSSLRAGWGTGSRPSRTTPTSTAIRRGASPAPTVRPLANSTSPTRSTSWTSARRPKKSCRSRWPRGGACRRAR